MNIEPLMNLLQHITERKITSLIPRTLSVRSSNGDYDNIRASVKYYENKKISELIVLPYFLGMHCDFYLTKSQQYVEYKIVCEGGKILSNSIICEAAMKSISRYVDSVDWDRYETIVLRGTLSPCSSIGYCPVNRFALDLFLTPSVLQLHGENKIEVMQREDFMNTHEFSDFTLNRMNRTHPSYNEMRRCIKPIFPPAMTTVDATTAQLVREMSEPGTVMFHPYTWVKKVRPRADSDEMPSDNWKAFRDVSYDEPGLQVFSQGNASIDQVISFFWECSKIDGCRGIYIRPKTISLSNSQFASTILCREDSLKYLTYAKRKAGSGGALSYDDRLAFITLENSILEEQELSERLEAIPYNLLQVSKPEVSQMLKDHSSALRIS